MKEIKLQTACVIPYVVSLLLTPLIGRPAQAQPAQVNVNLERETFGQLRELIRPQPGESRWMEIPWLTDVHAARQRAAAEGKPLFVYSGGGASGIGAC